MAKIDSASGISRLFRLAADSSDSLSIFEKVLNEAVRHTRADLGCLYMRKSGENPEQKRQSSKTAGAEVFRLFTKIGHCHIPKEIPMTAGFLSFIDDSHELLILLRRKASPFKDVLLHESMESGACIPIVADRTLTGFWLLNAERRNAFAGEHFRYLELVQYITEERLDLTLLDSVSENDLSRREYADK